MTNTLRYSTNGPIARVPIYVEGFTNLDIQEALTRASAGDTIVFPLGDYYITEAIVIDKTLTLIAYGATFIVDSIGDAVISLRSNDIVWSGGEVQFSSGVAADYGVEVLGTVDDVAVRDVTVSGAGRGFQVAGAGVGLEASRISFSRCRALSSVQYGFAFDDAQTITMNDCSSNVSGLDAIKARKNVGELTVIGGEFSGAAVGDGIDCYAGGHRVSLIGATFRDNAQNGVTCKADDLQRDNPAAYGYVWGLMAVGLRCFGNTGYGLTFHRAAGPSGDDLEVPLPFGAMIQGGAYEGNGGAGLLIGGRNVTVSGALCRANGIHGIMILPNALDVSIVGAQSIGNGTTSPGTYDGIFLDNINDWSPGVAYDVGDLVNNDSGKVYVCVTAGTSAGAGGPTGTGSGIADNTCVWDYSTAQRAPKRISISHCHVVGVDSFTATDDSEIGAATPDPTAVTRIGIYVHPYASEVVLASNRASHCVTADVFGGHVEYAYDHIKVQPTANAATKPIPTSGFCRFEDGQTLAAWRNTANTGNVAILYSGGTLFLGNSNAVSSTVYGGTNVKLNVGGDVVHVQAGKLGFFATSPVARQTITGSRGGNLALASLLDALELMGLITDSTS